MIIYAQGIPAVEAVPWKTIVVVAVTIGLLVGMMNAAAELIQAHQQVKQVQLITDIRDEVGHMRAGQAELQAATWDMHETMLSNAAAAVLPSKPAPRS